MEEICVNMGHSGFQLQKSVIRSHFEEEYEKSFVQVFCKFCRAALKLPKTMLLEVVYLPQGMSQACGIVFL